MCVCVCHTLCVKLNHFAVYQKLCYAMLSHFSRVRLCVTP